MLPLWNRPALVHLELLCSRVVPLLLSLQKICSGTDRAPIQQIYQISTSTYGSPHHTGFTLPKLLVLSYSSPRRKGSNLEDFRSSLRKQHLLMGQLQKLNCIISEGTGFRALYGWKDTEVSFPQNFTVCDFEFSWRSYDHFTTQRSVRISMRAASADGTTSKIKLYHLRRNGISCLIWLERYGS